MNLLQTVGQRLIHLRNEFSNKTETKVTSSYIAKEVLGVEPYVYWRYEKDKFKDSKVIPIEHIEKLANFYGVSKDYILKGEIVEEPKIPTLEEVLMASPIMFEGKLLSEEEKRIVLQFGGNAVKLKRGE